MSILKVAIASPLRRTFDYLPPAGLEQALVAALQPGVRLRVPFGKREVTGDLRAVEDQRELAPGELKTALEVLDPEPLVESKLMGLALWAAD